MAVEGLAASLAFVTPLRRDFRDGAATATISELSLTQECDSEGQPRPNYPSWGLNADGDAPYVVVPVSALLAAFQQAASTLTSRPIRMFCCVQ